MATKINYTPKTYTNGTTGNREKVIIRLCEAVNDLIDGGGGGGSTVTVNPTKASGEKIAEITVNGTLYDIYASPGTVTGVNGQAPDASGEVTLTYTDVGAAPGGYGLGGIGATITDADSADGTGFYRLDAGAANNPFVVRSLIVNLKYNDGYRVQVAACSRNYRVAYRYKASDGTWTDWVKWPQTGTPVGTVLFYAGTSAPSGYLRCDGSTYNIADYPELSAFFARHYGSANYWGGDGVDTFAVPDWRGEFFRASGVNSHANQGSGGAVGAHQDATTVPYGVVNAAGTQVNYRKATAGTATSVTGMDSQINSTTRLSMISATSGSSGGSIGEYYTTRPTNTSLLVCIKAES